MLEFQVGLAESESNRRCGSDRLVEVRVRKALDCLLKFRFYPIGNGKFLNDFYGSNISTSHGSGRRPMQVMWKMA